jgi:hypothetical protein
MKAGNEMRIPRGHLLAVLLVNAALWGVAIWVTHNHNLSGTAFASIASISSLLHVRS